MCYLSENNGTYLHIKQSTVIAFRGYNPVRTSMSYADDVILITKNGNDLQRLVYNFIKSWQKYGASH